MGGTLTIRWTVQGSVLSVRILRAKDLHNADIIENVGLGFSSGGLKFGKSGSDAFVVVKDKGGVEVGRTVAIHNSDTPEWHDKAFVVSKKPGEVEFSCEVCVHTQLISPSLFLTCLLACSLFLIHTHERVQQTHTPTHTRVYLCARYGTPTWWVITNSLAGLCSNIPLNHRYQC